MKANVRGHTVRYEVVGDAGPKVLLIMGFGMSGEAWLPVYEPLSKHFQLCWYDARGLGLSTPGEGPHTLQGLADDAAGLLAHLGWEDAHITGVSMGGMIAQYVALQHPACVRSLSLIATHAGGGPHKIFPRLKGLKLFAKANLSSGEKRMASLRELLFVDPDAKADSFNVETLGRFAQPAAPEVRLKHLRSIMRHNTRKRLHKLAEVPTLVIQGQHDLLVPPKTTTALAKAIPNATLHTIALGGHGLLSECADEVNGALVAHWDAVEASLAPA